LSNSNNGNHFYQNLQQLNKTSNIKTETQPVSQLKAESMTTSSNNGSSAVADPKAASASDSKNGFGSKTRKLDGYVGFANLPNQVYR